MTIKEILERNVKAHHRLGMITKDLYELLNDGHPHTLRKSMLEEMMNASLELLNEAQDLHAQLAQDLAKAEEPAVVVAEPEEKPVAKKTTRKVAAKKTPAKKEEVTTEVKAEEASTEEPLKKPVAKKTTARKTATKKVATKKTEAVEEVKAAEGGVTEEPAKKPVARKATAKKAPAKKVVAKK